MQTTTIYPHDYKGYEVRRNGFTWIGTAAGTVKAAPSIARLYELIDKAK